VAGDRFARARRAEDSFGVQIPLRCRWRVVGTAQLYDGFKETES
jgi:hypothetical protein